jgi:RNA polymerase sigma-70 factor (ECF subfamily)
MHNLSVDQGRRQREVAVGDLLAGDQVAAVERAWSNSEYTLDAATVVERAETRSELEDALARLPVIYRSTVLLHDGEGLTSREVADVQQIGLPAAKQRLRRGRMMLVTALARGAERRELLKGVPMRCWDARAMVSEYLDDELAQPDRERLERHLEACPTCPPLYSCLVGACAAVGAWRDPDTVIPAHILTRLSAFAE